MSIQEASGFADLGMWQEAWNAIEDAPAEDREKVEALRVRLRCCAPLGAWDIGVELARFLRDGNEEDRKAAALFWIALAKHDKFAAKDCLHAAIQAWPECRLAIIDDPELVLLLFPGLP